MVVTSIGLTPPAEMQCAVFTPGHVSRAPSSVNLHRSNHHFPVSLYQPNFSSHIHIASPTIPAPLKHPASHPLSFMLRRQRPVCKVRPPTWPSNVALFPAPTRHVRSRPARSNSPARDLSSIVSSRDLVSFPLYFSFVASPCDRLKSLQNASVKGFVCTCCPQTSTVAAIPRMAQGPEMSAAAISSS